MCYLCSTAGKNALSINLMRKCSEYLCLYAIINSDFKEGRRSIRLFMGAKNVLTNRVDFRDKKENNTKTNQNAIWSRYAGPNK